MGCDERQQDQTLAEELDRLAPRNHGPSIASSRWCRTGVDPAWAAVISEQSLRPAQGDREVGHLQRRLKDLGVYGSVGLEFGLSVLVGLFLGQWLDRKLNTGPWAALTGMGFGTAAGIRTLYRTAEKARKELEEEERKEADLRREYNERYRKK